MHIVYPKILLRSRIFFFKAAPGKKFDAARAKVFKTNLSPNPPNMMWLLEAPVSTPQCCPQLSVAFAVTYSNMVQLS
jgi:hypothetical protein